MTLANARTRNGALLALVAMVLAGLARMKSGTEEDPVNGSAQAQESPAAPLGATKPARDSPSTLPELPDLPAQGIPVETEERHSIARALAILVVEVRHGDRALPHVKVLAINNEIFEFRTGSDGTARMVLDPGTWEVAIPAEGNGAGALVRYPPDGTSSAEITLEAGQEQRVILEAYPAATLVIEIPDAASHRELCRVFHFADGQWVEPRKGVGTQSDRATLRGLEPGHYCVMPPAQGHLDFPEERFELTFGESRTVAPNARFAVPCRLRVQATGTAAPGPEGALVRYSIAPRTEEDADTAGPGPGTTRCGGQLASEPLEHDLVPGTYRIELSTKAREFRDGPLLQCFAEPTTWTLPFTVNEDGSTSPAALDLALGSGPIARISGRIAGSQASRRPCWLRLVGNDQEPRELIFHPGKEGRWQALIDLGGGHGHAAEIVVREGKEERVLDSLTLQPGENEWTVSL